MPGGLEMGAAGQQGIDGSGWDLLDQQTKQLQGRWVRPVQIFQDKEDRVTFGKFLHDRHESFERFLALTLW